jgi:hypothetical protein
MLSIDLLYMKIIFFLSFYMSYLITNTRYLMMLHFYMLKGTEYSALDCRKRPVGSEGEDRVKRIKIPVDKQTLYIKQLLHDFGKCCDGDISKKEPRVQLYPGIGTHSGQTSTCSGIALEYYNRTEVSTS